MSIFLGDNRIAGGAGVGGISSTRAVFTPLNGQTVFTLATAPTLPHLSQIFLNGVKAIAANPPNLQFVVSIWNALIATGITIPANGVDEWNAIAIGANVPLSYDLSGNLGAIN